MKTTVALLTCVILILPACKPEKPVAKETTPPAPAVETTAADVSAAIPYPLDTCLVSGEKLGSMGKPPEIVYEGRQIKFCCKHCIPDFEKEPAKFLSKLK